MNNTSQNHTNNEIPNNAKVGILGEFPMPIIFGGLEIQCLESYKALHKLNSQIELVDYYNPKQEFDLLHIFGNPASMYEICHNLNRNKKLLISTVFGGAKISRPQSLAIKSLSKLLCLGGQKIDYTRVRSMLHLADHIISLNSIEKEFICERFDIENKKVTVIPNGVPDRFFGPKKDLFVDKYHREDFVIYVGNIIPRKNPVLLAKALLELDLSGVFLGPAIPTEEEYAEELEDLVNSSEKLLWIKDLANTDPLIPSAYAASKVLCLPSAAEGQSLVSLEAMAAGKPIILGDYPYAYQAEYHHALRCNPYDHEALKLTIKEAYANTENYTYQLPEAEYSWENIARRIIEVYAKILQ